MFCDHSSGYSVALFLYRKDAYARVRELMAAHDTAVASGCDDSADHAVKDAGQRTSTDDRTADGGRRITLGLMMPCWATAGDGE